jgi:hypothetical protein
MAVAGTMDTGSTKKDKDQSMLMKELLPLSMKSREANNEALYYYGQQTQPSSPKTTKDKAMDLKGHCPQLLLKNENV